MPRTLMQYIDEVVAAAKEEARKRVGQEPESRKAGQFESTFKSPFLLPTRKTLVSKLPIKENVDPKELVRGAADLMNSMEGALAIPIEPGELTPEGIARNTALVLAEMLCTYCTQPPLASAVLKDLETCAAFQERLRRETQGEGLIVREELKEELRQNLGMTIIDVEAWFAELERTSKKPGLYP